MNRICLLVILVFIVTACKAQDLETPYYVVKVNIEGFTADIALNGVTVSPEGVHSSPVFLNDSEAPVNHWIATGNNEFVVHLKPYRGNATGKAEVSLIKYKRFASDTMQVMETITYSGTLEDTAGVKIMKTVVLQTPFPRWAWLDSDVIPDTWQTHQELIQQYQHIWDALKAKQPDSLFSSFDEQIGEYARAHPQGKGDPYREQKEELESAMKRAVADSTMELFPLEPEDSILKVFGNGRLAKLTRWDGMPMIGFNYTEEDGGSETFDFIFRKEGDKWIIAR